jgi:hypothetical protein
VNPPDAIGWGASALMLMTFTCECARSLRTFAVAANLAFIAYGWTSGLAPVLVLHLVLLPINVVRLVGALRASAAASVPVPGHLGLQRLDHTARCEPLQKLPPDPALTGRGVAAACPMSASLVPEPRRSSHES